jgi:SAM-dependent methyltransferase
MMKKKRHQREIRRNRAQWNNKAVLRIIYRRFYQKIAALFAEPNGFPILEIGSGIGQISNIVPQCIKTDLFPNPSIDVVENAYQLSFASESVSNLVLVDVFHHLKFPGSALEEFYRVLMPGGRVIILEPCLSVLGIMIYGCLHKEPLGLFRDIDWKASTLSESLHQGYYAAQGNAFRVFCRDGFRDKIDGWRIICEERISALPYIATGGYSRPALCTVASLKKWDTVDKIVQKFPLFFATRLLIGMEKRSKRDSRS